MISGKPVSIPPGQYLVANITLRKGDVSEYRPGNSKGLRRNKGKRVTVTKGEARLAVEMPSETRFVLTKPDANEDVYKIVRFQLLDASGGDYRYLYRSGASHRSFIQSGDKRKHTGTLLFN